MVRILAGVCLALVVMPVSVRAENTPITRREGFLLLWQSIRRPVEENRERPFADVVQGSRGFAEITYAKYRGILDEGELFHPDQPLMIEDALLWLFRTRSVDDLQNIRAGHLPSLLHRYPVEIAGDLKHEVSEGELTALMRSLDEFLLREEHEVSLYAEQFHGKGTAFGESFNMHALTAAHRTLPKNTLVKVRNVRNGKSVTVRINDRGPYVEGRDMDLSLAAFTAIEDRSKGILRATFQRLGDATLAADCPDRDLRRAIRITNKTRLIGGIPATLPIGRSLTLRSTRPFVLRQVRYPDGAAADLQDWVLPGESHAFTPAIEGEYLFTLSARDGRTRRMRMAVVRCTQ